MPPKTDAALTIADPRLREALAGAGTSVWEWHIAEGRLADIGEGTALLGYAPGEVEPTQRAWDALIHPDDRPGNDAAYARHARGETETYEHEYRIRARDGSWRWMAERGRIVERGAGGAPLRMLGTQTDITERRRAEGEARELDQRMRKIARHVPGMVFQFRRAADGSACFPYVSERCVALTGIAPGRLMDDAAAMLRRVERSDRDRMLAQIEESMRTSLAWRCEFRLYRPGGALCWLRGSATPQPGDEGATLWHGYIEDVTELRALEQARVAAIEAEAANRAKTEFLSRMSHELRTPLNAVLGFTQLLQNDPAEPASAGQQRRLGLIRGAAEHLLQMIGDLLDLTRIESGRIAIEPGWIELDALARECADLLRPQAGAAGVRVELDSAPGARQVFADRRRLRQVLLNLLSNAVKYNRRGGAVRLRVLAAEGGSAIEVEDDGPGIAPHEQAHLFEPFNRLGQQRGAVEGSGIGLALSRSLVEAMGGRIELRSSAGAGSTFRVWLPCPPG